MNSENKKAAFSIQYNREGIPVDVTSDDEEVTISSTRGQELPPDVKTDNVATTTIIGGHHNPQCRYIWVPKRGWVWICW
jgi:hypothetical protein